eukprot:3035470-Rhodomonas_salina.1
MSGPGISSRELGRPESEPAFSAFSHTPAASPFSHGAVSDHLAEACFCQRNRAVFCWRSRRGWPCSGRAWDKHKLFQHTTSYRMVWTMESRGCWDYPQARSWCTPRRLVAVSIVQSPSLTLGYPWSPHPTPLPHP